MSNYIFRTGNTTLVAYLRFRLNWLWRLFLILVFLLPFAGNFPSPVQAVVILNPDRPAGFTEYFDLQASTAAVNPAESIDSDTPLEYHVVLAGGSPVTVSLDDTYTDPVVICSAQYNNNTIPIVPRISSLTSTSFDIRLQNPSDGTVLSENVSCIVVEAGVWEIDGVKFEAQKYTSTVTDNDSSWTGQAQSYGQSYTNPVVIGQVMSENDTDWSVFWCRGNSATEPPSTTSLYTGKTVAEDSDTTREDETVGFIVFDAGHNTIGGVEFESLVGPNNVQGVDDSPPYSYDFATSFASDPEVTLANLAGMGGSNGGWAQTHGPTAASSTSIYLSVDEDQISDTERNRYVAEYVAYVVFDVEPLAGPTITLAGTPLSAFSTQPGTPSAVQSYRVSGSSLTADITVTAPTDFQVSLLSDSGFGSSLTLPQSGGSVPETTIFVRFNRTLEGTSSGNITNASSGAVTRSVAVSGIAAPITPVSFNILLGRPTDESITYNIIPDMDTEFYIEYGVSPGVYTSQTGTFNGVTDEPIEFVIDGLSANTEYFYHVIYRQAGETAWNHGSEYSFTTQKPPGSSFVFTIISDSHLGQYGGQTTDELALYETTLQNVATDNPDFHMDLGDTFAMDPSPLGTGMTEEEADAAYYVQRPYLGEITHSIPFFLAFGNHENEEGWNFDDVFTPPDQSLAIVGLRARKIYYPNPIPDDFYTGNTDPFPAEFAAAYGDEFGDDIYREDYYAWEWGDALFVVIEPYHYSDTWPNDDGQGYGGEGQDGEVSGDRWDWTLGIQQYLWFKDVLENSDAAYKLVFSHHVAGGATPYGRGGILAAPYFEWGGYNADDTWGWNAERPSSAGWDVPIHQLMVNNGVDIYFHGHDHIYAYEELDGVVYLEVPKPDDAGYDWEPYGYGYTENLYPGGLMIQNSGHIRVTVTPTGVKTEYVRSYLPGDGTNGYIEHTVIVDNPVATHELTVEMEPAEGGTTTPSAGAHFYPENDVVNIFADPASGYDFDHWSGDVANPGNTSTTITMDSDKTVTAHFIQQSACINVDVSPGWNLISIPVAAVNMALSSLFPEVVPPAYEFTDSYQAVSSGENLFTGTGYWVYFNESHTYQVCGAIEGSKDLPVNIGWNMIGSFDTTVDIGTITSDPAGILQPPVYGFSDSYYEATTLNPGLGYWVYVSQAGTLHLATP